MAQEQEAREEGENSQKDSRGSNKCLQSLTSEQTDPKTCTALSQKRVASLGTSQLTAQEEFQCQSHLNMFLKPKGMCVLDHPCPDPVIG